MGQISPVFEWSKQDGYHNHSKTRKISPVMARHKAIRTNGQFSNGLHHFIIGQNSIQK
jgi:hypothetical protein